MTRLRVSLRVPVGRPLPGLVDFIVRCESAGFDGVGIHDHPSSGRDAYVALALAARATRRLTLFPATSSPIVRHPLLLASLAHSLEELAPGRARLTMAPGFISTRSIGKPRGTVAAMREAPRRAPAARGRGGRLRADRDAAAEPQRGPHAGVPARGRPTHDRAGRSTRPPSARRATTWPRAPAAPAGRWTASRWFSW